MLTTVSAGNVAVHPRVCGELMNELDNLDSVDGSSPRVWGTHVQRMVRCGRLRFIPACVGNSDNKVNWLALLTVHPRVCGELAEDGHKSVHAAGSSPRVWGTP